MTIEQVLQSAKADTSRPGWRTSLAKPQQASFDPARSYFLKVATSKGPLRIKFLPDVAPMHVTSFLYLAKLGFFDGLSFHRVIRVHGAGGARSNGTGDPATSSTASTARTSATIGRGFRWRPGPETGQFFLTFVPTPWLTAHGLREIVGDGNPRRAERCPPESPSR
jgi:cyclophilin family peptidyl-prolyl cis-trans isomerase